MAQDLAADKRSETAREPTADVDLSGSAELSAGMATEPVSKVSRTFRLWLWMLAPMLIVCAASSTQVSAPFVPSTDLLQADKIGHIAVFGLIATLLYRALPQRWSANKRSLLTVGIVILFGLADEIHQSFTPGRDADGYDLLADTCGALLAVAAYRWFHLYRRILEWQIFPPQKISNQPLPASA